MDLTHPWSIPVIDVLVEVPDRVSGMHALMVAQALQVVHCRLWRSDAGEVRWAPPCQPTFPEVYLRIWLSNVHNTDQSCLQMHDNHCYSLWMM
jgi:hypothetical protein